MTEPIADRRPLIGLPGTRKSVPGLPFVVRAHAEETGGVLEVYEVGVPDARAGLGAGPPPHVHREHEETFYVLEGEFEFFLDGDRTTAPTGTLIVVPRGTPHNFRGTPGSRLLVVATPGGLAGFFEELAAGHAEGRPDADVRAALAGKYDAYPVRS
jgi:mannose-6-phosphate isomerase-like protein (cupin superfamily)